MNDLFAEQLECWLADPQDTELPEDFEWETLGDSAAAEEAFGALELKEGLHEAISRPGNLLRPSRLVWAGGLLAAVLALVILLPGDPGPSGDLSLRLRSAGNSAAAKGQEPHGFTEHFPREFHWHPAQFSAGTRFRWELYDSQARRRGMAVVADSMLVRKAIETPDDSLGTWLWLVVELTQDGREGPTSGAVEFTVRKKGGP